MKPAPLFAKPIPPRVVRFTVYGTPVPQGSMRAFKHKTTGAVINMSDNKRLRPWRQQVSGVAVALNESKFERDIALALMADFYFVKPPSATKKRQRPTVKPDLDKLLRSCCDAITGVLICDDAQVVSCCGRKFYGDPERMEVVLTEIC
jgi:crossover junction endodeoxyribonuclease RusA